MKRTHYKLIIIGSGPAGLTAGIYASRANLEPLIIEGTAPGGQLMGTTAVENWPGEASIMGPQLMMNMRAHAQRAGCLFDSGEVVSCQFTSRPYALTTSKGREFTADSIIIASGATPKRLNIPGEKEYWGKGVTTCAVCDGAFYKDLPVVIVGGGDTAMENASFMTNYTKSITILHIGPQLSASAAMQERVLNNPHIRVIYNASIDSIEGDEQILQKVTYTDKHSNQKQELPARAVFIAIGLQPNTKPFAGQIKLHSNGYLALTEGTQTSVPGIFGAGDVADAVYRQAIVSAGSGCMAALDAERYLKHLE